MFIMAEACTSVGIKNIDQIFGIVKLGITFMQYLIPFVLILWGTIDLFKAITAGKEDEIKKKQQALYKRAIAAVIVFILPWLVVTIIGFITSDSSIVKCYKDTKAGIPSINNTIEGE